MEFDVLKVGFWDNAAALSKAEQLLQYAYDAVYGIYGETACRSAKGKWPTHIICIKDRQNLSIIIRVDNEVNMARAMAWLRIVKQNFRDVFDDCVETTHVFRD